MDTECIEHEHVLINYTLEYVLFVVMKQLQIVMERLKDMRTENEREVNEKEKRIKNVKQVRRLRSLRKQIREENRKKDKYE